MLSRLTKERGEGVDFCRELAREGFEKGFSPESMAPSPLLETLYLCPEVDVVPLKRLCGEIVVITDMSFCSVEKLLHIKGCVLLLIGFKRGVPVGCVDSDSKRIA
ncbi:hypothetical protein PIB30_102616 [Stylosanthes scabra]|uniref:Uncharacterized protein n=1 Tax=Stylosanthes scabra TaxID=79078 RepID=A0ABU6TYH0_9FABA|nr:hypothetical protein [Stylosanthes scabra]